MGDKPYLLLGDCREVLLDFEDNSIDAVVTDPPYGLEFMGKDWDNLGRNSPPSFEHSMQNDFKGFKPLPRPGGLTVKGMKAAQAWHTLWAESVFRVLKPGGHLLAFGGTRTYHRLACALEDSGFEIRDCLQWLYGSGFPKSLDVSKAIDKAAGVEREVTGFDEARYRENRTQPVLGEKGYDRRDNGATLTKPTTSEAATWQGWGTALKPANEPIVLARKPLSEKTVAANVLRWGTGALNIDGCRIGTEENLSGGAYSEQTKSQPTDGVWRGERKSDSRAMRNAGLPGQYEQPLGRWPANLILDEEAARMLDEQSGTLKSGDGNTRRKPHQTNAMAGTLNTLDREEVSYGDSGGASRFFYCAKASKKERGGSNNHPTVKPISLMAYLCRLITPPSGIVLDPFMGSGTTGIAALQERFEFIGIEKEESYLKIARKRIGVAK